MSVKQNTAWPQAAEGGEFRGIRDIMELGEGSATKPRRYAE
jgi:hypothetical protein